MSLVARHLESNGIATLVLGSAIDIVEHCGVPRYLHSDFPLGNPCGTPYDSAMQQQIMQQALELLQNAKTPNSTARTPFVWSEDNSWRDDYAHVDNSNREKLRVKGEQRRQQQVGDKAAGQKRAAMIAET